MQDHKIKHEPSINFWRFATGCSSSGTYLITGASRSRCFGYGKKVQARAAETKGLFFQAREPHPSLRHRGACSTWTHFRKSIIPLETMVETDPLLQHLHEHCFKIATLAHSKLGALAP